MNLIQLFEGEDKLDTLYCSRNLVNAQDVIDWAKTQGFTNCVSTDDMHVTVAFSKAKVDWNLLTDNFDNVYSRKDGKDDGNGPRSVEEFRGNAIVLTFENADLERRWEEFKDDFGASWDFPEYRPHITITYDGLPEGMTLEDIEPYEGELHFGPEKMEPVKINWKAGIKEKKLTEQKGEDCYYVQPDGVWEKTPSDGRSEPKTRAEVLALGGKIR